MAAINEFSLKRVPMFGRVSLLSGSVFVVYMDDEGREAVPTYHGFPVEIDQCDNLIEKLIAHRMALESNEAKDMHDAISEAQSRLSRWGTRQEKIGKPGYVYSLMNKLGYFKIGKSVCPDDRIAQLNHEYGDKLTIFNLIPCPDMDWAELYLHDMFQEFRVGGEWFALPMHLANWLSRVTSLQRTNIGIGEFFTSR